MRDYLDWVSLYIKCIPIILFWILFMYCFEGLISSAQLVRDVWFLEKKMKLWREM